jgi:hypothetical protein
VINSVESANFLVIFFDMIALFTDPNVKS